MKIVSPSEQITAKQMIVNRINTTILSTPLEQKEIILNTDTLFINSNTIDCGEKFMDGLCKEYEAKGWYMKYCPHLSFVWRHQIIISKEPLIEWRQIPGHSKYTCFWDKTEAQEKERKKL